MKGFTPPSQSFKEGDRVRINSPRSRMHGAEGTFRRWETPKLGRVCLDGLTSNEALASLGLIFNAKEIERIA